MKIISKDGIADNIQILDDDGNDLKKSLSIKTLILSVKPGGVVEATLVCLVKEMELHDVEQMRADSLQQIIEPIETPEMERVRTTKRCGSCSRNAGWANVKLEISRDKTTSTQFYFCPACGEEL